MRKGASAFSSWPAASGVARYQEQMREPAGSRTFCPAARCSRRNARHHAQAPAPRFSLSILLPPGGWRPSARPSVNRPWQRLGSATNLNQLVCDGKTLRSSIEATAVGSSAFFAQMTVYPVERTGIATANKLPTCIAGLDALYLARINHKNHKQNYLSPRFTLHDWHLSS